MSDRSPLVPLQPDGDRAPLFLFPGIGGEFFSLAALVRHLHPAQPVYGLRGQGPDLPPGSSLVIESMAAIYVDAIRQVQPAGPYLMAAYSAGCMLAYEAAQQLLAGGGQIVLLAMIDAEVPREIVPLVRWAPAWVLRFPRNLAFWIVDDLLASNTADLLVRARSKIRLVRAWTRRDAPGVPGGGPQSDVRDRLGVPLLPERYAPWIEAFLDALGRYHPRPYPGRIVLLSARTQPLFGNLARDKGWGAFAQDGVDVRVIAGDHANILREPRVRLLAAALTRAADEAAS